MWCRLCVCVCVCIYVCLRECVFMPQTHTVRPSGLGWMRVWLDADITHTHTHTQAAGGCVPGDAGGSTPKALAQHTRTRDVYECEYGCGFQSVSFKAVVMHEKV